MWRVFLLMKTNARETLQCLTSLITFLFLWFIQLKKIKTSIDLSELRNLQRKPAKETAPPVSTLKTITLERENSQKPNRSYPNVNDSRFNLIQEQIKFYKQNHPQVRILIKRLSGSIEKDRHLAREAYFNNLVSFLKKIYGIYEIEEHIEKGKICCNRNSEERIKEMSKSEKYDLAKRLSIEIESYCFILFNSRNKNEIMKTYKTKNRSLLTATMNNANFELRCRVLVGDLKAEDFVNLREEVIAIIKGIAEQRKEERNRRTRENVFEDKHY